MNRKPSHVVAAAAAALSLGTLSSLAGLAPAYAAPIIDPNAPTSLTIHKYLGATTSLPHDGRQLTPEQEATIAATKLSGIEFDVYKVGGADLTTNAGWDAAKALYGYKITATDIAAGSITVGTTTYPLTKVVDNRETTNGTLNLASLDVALYLVVEDLANSSNRDASKITASAPFLVTLPTSYGDPSKPGTDTWVYDLHVYPKNSQDSITKQVLDGNLGTENQDAPKVGTNLTYRLESTISPVADLGTYVIGDNLSPYVTYVSSTVSIKSGTTLTALITGTDYTVVTDSNATMAGHQVKITLTRAGLDKLEPAKAATATATVATDVVATVTSLPAAGLVPNTAWFVPNSSWVDQTPGDDYPGIPSNKVESKYGDILINKTNDAGTLPLAGAAFDLYRAGANTTCEAADFVDANKLGTATTDATGKVEFSGLQLSNWYNNGVTSGAITDVTKYHNYCLVETKAPTGYQLLAQPLTVTLTKEGVTTALDGQQVDVKNMLDNLSNKLPLTGGQGVAAMSALGALLVGGGLAYYAISSRRRTNA